MNPSTPQEWIAIAIERAADAEALKQSIYDWRKGK